MNSSDNTETLQQILVAILDTLPCDHERHPMTPSETGAFVLAVTRHGVALFRGLEVRVSTPVSLRELLRAEGVDVDAPTALLDLCELFERWDAANSLQEAAIGDA